MTSSKTEISKTEIVSTVTYFLSEWDRQVWMQDNGEWASEDWDNEREEYDSRLEALKDALVSADKLDNSAASYLRAQMEALLECVEKLDSQVLPDESDYTSEGTIDPDNLKDKCEEVLASSFWSGWDCTEGWDAYRVGDDLVLNWWRNAYNNRHQRDLWLIIEKDYFYK